MYDAVMNLQITDNSIKLTGFQNWDCSETTWGRARVIHQSPVWKRVQDPAGGNAPV